MGCQVASKGCILCSFDEKMTFFYARLLSVYGGAVPANNYFSDQHCFFLFKSAPPLTPLTFFFLFRELFNFMTGNLDQNFGPKYSRKFPANFWSKLNCCNILEKKKDKFENMKK